MKEGLQEVRRHKGIAWLMGISVLVTFFLMPVATLFPLMTVVHFEGSTFQMSLIEMIWGGGTLTGGLILGIWKFKVRKVILINISYLVLGAYLIGSGLLPTGGFTLFVLLTVIGGLSAPFYSSPFTTLLQTYIAPTALGRVFSLFGSLSLLPAVIGLLATGFIADHIGITRAFIYAGTIITLLGIFSFSVTSIMQLEKKKRHTNTKI